MLSQPNFNILKYGEIFPRVENILQCGMYLRSIHSNEVIWSRGIYDLLDLPQTSPPPDRSLFLKCISESDRDRVIKTTRKSEEDNEPYKMEFNITTLKGVQKRLYAENYLVFDENNKVKEYYGLLKDITESYNATVELNNKVISLNKSNASLQEFAYVASHDLHEPLRKILTFVDRVNSKFGNTFNTELKMYCDKITNSANSMQTLLNDLLDFSRLSTKPIQIENVALNTVMESTLNGLEILIEENNVEITYQLPHTIEGFFGQLQQLFTNLISNSIKFSRNEEACKIKIESNYIDPLNYQMFPLTLNKKYIGITVKDNGIGFDQSYSEKIFEVFQRLHGKAEYKGSGIGLSICKKITENHAGFIYASGKKNEGATFTIILPENQNNDF
jgi:light-regulated signal transduction histidine kinase (bacteriophytochrome)